MLHWVHFLSPGSAAAMINFADLSFLSHWSGHQHTFYNWWPMTMPLFQLPCHHERLLLQSSFLLSSLNNCYKSSHCFKRLFLVVLASALGAFGLLSCTGWLYWYYRRSRSHGSVRVVRTTSKVNGKCWTLTPKSPMNPLSDRHQIWRAWLRHGYLPPRKKWAQSVNGFLLPTWVKYTPKCSLRYATLRSRMFTTFFGSSNRLQPRRLHGF